LEAAFKKLDPRQLSLVFDALHERASFLENAPHLTRKLPIMTPCYAYWEIPYYWFGLKMYDMLSLNKRLASSRYVSRKESLLQFPMLANKDLKGSVVYYDGQMDDSRYVSSHSAPKREVLT
jgi:glycerol-3-phosphate dehydrogenase